jgi:hypothetical protein
MAGSEIGLLQEPDESFAEHLVLNPTFRRLEAWLFQMLLSGRPSPLAKITAGWNKRS